MIRVWLALALFAAALESAGAAAREPLRLQSAPFFVSRSGQFHVRLQQEPERAEALREGDVFLEPNFVAVSAERVKAALLREFRIPDRARGKIHLAICPSKSSGEVIPVLATSYNDGWHYAVQLPQRIGELQFVRALTHALLMEIANRGGASRSAEIPLWLSEGMSQRLLYEIGGGFLVKPQTYTDQTRVRYSPAFFFRELKPDLKLLSFTEMTEARPNPGTNEFMQRFIGTTLLFIGELQSMPDGHTRLLRFLQLLPHRWNWQTALLEAYHPHFQSLLDIEKWWSVALADLSAQHDRVLSPSDAALRPLDLILRTAVEARAATNALPEESTMSLQEFIRGTDFATHREAVRVKIAQLLQLQFRSGSELGALAEMYRQALEQYHEAQDSRQPTGSLPLPSASIARTAKERAIRDLDKADQERHALRERLAARSTAHMDPRVRDPRRQR